MCRNTKESTTVPWVNCFRAMLLNLLKLFVLVLYSVCVLAPRAWRRNAHAPYATPASVLVLRRLPFAHSAPVETSRSPTMPSLALWLHDEASALLFLCVFY